MTQCQRVLRHLHDHGAIDPMTAIREYGIYRLSARISDLRRQGYPIIGRPERGLNRYGEPVHYSVYRLKEGENR